jgi:hypothetical protein
MRLYGLSMIVCQSEAAAELSYPVVAQVSNLRKAGMCVTGVENKNSRFHRSGKCRTFRKYY